MENGNERSPLLYPMASTSWTKRLRHGCLNTSQKTATGLSLGILLVVITSFLIVENLRETPDKVINVHEKLLGSSGTKEKNEKNDNKVWHYSRYIEKTKKKEDVTFYQPSEYSGDVTTREDNVQKLQQFLQSAAIPKGITQCAFLTEDVRRTLGKCVDMSFLPADCKPWANWRTKCKSKYKYRKIEGTCNNQIHPTWGTSGTPYVRMIAPVYSDGVSNIRTSESGLPLPNARQLSSKLFSSLVHSDIDASMLFLNFGVFLEDDMVETAISPSPIPCCDERFTRNPTTRPKECLQIEVDEADSFYGPKNVKCLNLQRSTPVNGECAGRREQLNEATSFLDGSNIYGSAIQQTKKLRTFNSGKLRTQMIGNSQFMPSAEGSGFICGPSEEPLKCFQAGDPRVNMMVQIAAMHTLWLREHNRIAGELKKLNPWWTDEILFQEARRLLIAELQHITYNEFLPLLLGQEALKDFNLDLNEDEKYEGYDPTVDPSIFNVFGTAAFKFIHSQIQGMLHLVGPDDKIKQTLALHDTFFNLQLLYHNELDSLLKGAASQPTHAVDSYASSEVRDHLLQVSGQNYGFDVIAIEIQKERDHGLPSYPTWRKACGLPEVLSWNDLYDLMDKEHADKLKDTYESVYDIDLMPGALAEKHVKGSLLGPTLQCIIGRQFKKTKKADRFWFEDTNQIGSFTTDQLKEIYNSNMARIICDNSDGIQIIQVFPFKVPSKKNPVIDCSYIPYMDLSKWS